MVDFGVLRVTLDIRHCHSFIRLLVIEMRGLWLLSEIEKMHVKGINKHIKQFCTIAHYIFWSNLWISIIYLNQLSINNIAQSEVFPMTLVDETANVPGIILSALLHWN